ncbi:SPX domain-containing protein [Mycena galopus ATCC 62051]|nr:SPX domain-containing protein [Mycena galopus ATCC 62051]
MHFSKTYLQLLQACPPELRENAVDYRQLKKLINQLVAELESLGLGPTVLQDLLKSGEERGADEGISTRLEYQFNIASGRIEPRLRLWVNPPRAPSPLTKSHVKEVQDAEDTESDSSSDSQADLRLSVQDLGQDGTPTGSEIEIDMADDPNEEESRFVKIIPLVSDSAFFELLVAALRRLSEQLGTVHAQFVKTLAELTRTVSDAARPVSSTSRAFKAQSALNSDGGGVRGDVLSRKSDLYTWREIFQLYVESEVFESVNELHPGERTIEEAETRLTQFTERVAARNLSDGHRLKLPQSRRALESFLQLNVFILNVKRFEFANAEATRKILKKRAKRTALPATDSSNTSSLDLLPVNTSLPRILVQELGTTLLPIIPSLEDYTCLICTSIAFKPIRLSCGHLFCVRCLVKMQKRGNAQCPMCRAPCVLVANRSNVDWALMNFMRDWFPEESDVKRRQNEKEVSEEELREMGIDPDARCLVM